VRKGGALLGAAGAHPSTLEVWSGDWLAEMIRDQQVLKFSPDAKGTTAVRLIGTVSQKPWLQGENGFSRKGECDTCASHYYSLSRIPFSGEVRTPSGIRPVVGLGWMDHEFMSNTLAPDQVGWDWMGLMLRDGRSLTVFRLRDAHGNTSYASASILNNQTSELIPAHEILLTPSDEWRSSSTGARYPLTWRVQIPSRSIDVTVRARVAACEIGDGSSDVEPRYWEGPVSAADESVIGYLEMTGYAGKVRL
jgi:predicted secreted hydrolase